MPIDREGALVGYCGIAVTDEEPLFKFPEKWVAGVEIYNLTQAIKFAEEALRTGEDPTITVYRNILQVWQAIRLGYQCNVALMGDCITSAQFQLLRDHQVLSRFPVALQLHVEGGLM